MDKSPFHPPVFTSAASFYSPIYGNLTFATATTALNVDNVNKRVIKNKIEDKKTDIIKSINNFIDIENNDDLTMSLLYDIQIQIQKYKIKSDREKLNDLIEKDKDHKNNSGICIDPMPKLKKLKIYK